MTRKNNSDLIVGGVIFISLFILIFGVLWLKGIKVSRKFVSHTIVFNNIGTLQCGDPVTVNGVKKGSVASIRLDKAEVIVAIKLEKGLYFTDSAHVCVANIGLMGERVIAIYLSEQGTLYQPDSGVLIPGYFDSGIAEAMGMAGNVLADVKVLLDTVKQIVYETIGDTNFTTTFNSFLNRLDSITIKVNAVIKRNENSINSSIENVRGATAEFKDIINDNKENIQRITDNGVKLTDDALIIANRIDSIAVTLNMIITNVDNGKGTVGMLLKDDAIVNELQNSLYILDSLLMDIDSSGLKLRTKLFGNRKYFKD